MAVDIQSMIIQQYMKELFRNPEEQRRSELSVKTLERADELSDLSLLTSMLKGATTENEWNLALKTNKEVQKRAVGKDPVTIAAINATGLQIEENSTLYNQFKSANKLVNGLLTQGELDDPTIENLNWEQILKKNADLGRFQHMINLGKEKGYTYSPEKGTGEGYLHSNILSKRLDDYIEEFDVLVKFSMDKGDGKDLPGDAKRAIQIGDLAGFETIKTRDTGTYRNLVNTHSSRYTSLHNTKMQADTKKNVDGTLNLMPAAMLADLKNQGEGQFKAFMEAINKDQTGIIAQAFMGGAKSGSGITVDYDTYSMLLDAQMEIEKQYINSANTKFRSYTGENVETFRESTSYEVMKEKIKETGLQVDGDGDVDGDDDGDGDKEVWTVGDTGKPVISKSRLPKIEEQIMSIITPYKDEIVSLAGSEVKKEAQSKAVKKYSSTMNKRIADIEEKRDTEIQAQRMRFFPLKYEYIRKNEIKKINKKYNTQLKQIKGKYFRSKETIVEKGDWVKPPTVDELFVEMDIFDKLLKNKVDLDAVGLSDKDKNILRDLLITYKQSGK